MKKYVFWLCVFAVIEISIALYLTIWREHFWNAVAQKQSVTFMYQLGVFTTVALGACFVSGFSGYLVSLTTIKWREKLNAKAVEIRNSRIENMNQRIQEDCWNYPNLVLSLLYGSLKALMYIIVFIISLVLSFNFIYVVILMVYTVIGSIVTHYIAKPLIHLNYEQQRAEATYRNCLSITNFKDCLGIMLGLAKKQKHLTYFQQFYGQVGVVLPLILIAPVYFTTNMNIGNLMRFNSLSSTILDNMSYGISNFGTINMLLSCKKRLKEARII